MYLLLVGYNVLPGTPLEDTGKPGTFTTEIISYPNGDAQEIAEEAEIKYSYFILVEVIKG